MAHLKIKEFKYKVLKLIPSFIKIMSMPKKKPMIRKEDPSKVTISICLHQDIARLIEYLLKKVEIIQLRKLELIRLSKVKLILHILV